MAETNNGERWNDVTIADLRFFDRLGTLLSSGAFSSWSQVAKAADFTNSHLSNTLKKLEGASRFGKKLVDRKNFSLMKEGEQVLDYARRVLTTYVNRPFQEGRVTLRIAGTNRILTTLLASYFYDFLRVYKAETKSDIDIEIIEATSEQVLHLLEIGDVELAFGGLNNSADDSSKIATKLDFHHRKLEVETLHEKLRMVLVAPPKGMGAFSIRNKKDGIKATKENLSNTNLCLVRRDHRGSFSWIPDPSRGYTRIVVDNYSAVIAMVRAGVACGLLIDRGIPSDFKKFELADPNLSTQNFAVWHRKGIELSPAAAALKKSLGVGKRKRQPTKKKG